MVLKIDFDSEEALYTQLCNQIICGIAMDVLHDGDSLPSVRQLADEIGINMHTVNKAYAVLKQDVYKRQISGTRWQKCIQRNLPVRSIRKRRSL